MITDKQIEEAIRNYSKALDEEQILSFAWRDFKAGAHWAINELLKGLWHDVKEEPKKEKFILIEYNQSGAIRYYISRIYESIDWVALLDTFRITRWLYIDDYVPKKK